MAAAAARGLFTVKRYWGPKARPRGAEKGRWRWCGHFGGHLRGNAGARWVDHSVRHDVGTMFAKATTNDSLTVTEAMLESLPPPVRRYLSYTGVVGKPITRTVYLAQSGRMRLGPGQPWLSPRAKQYYSAQPPGFVWDGTVRAGPVAIGRARDMYMDGKCSMLVKALSLFSVVDAQGGEID